MDGPKNQEPLTAHKIVGLWLPLLSTWLMMAVEGPLLAAFVARMEDPRIQLAAWGVAINLAILVEAPVIMLLSAATALAKDRRSFDMLRRFSLAMCGGLTFCMAMLVLTPGYAWMAKNVMGLEVEVVEASRDALAWLLPWPAAIGYRRLYQGVMIRVGSSRLVAYGTVARLVAMSVSMSLLFHLAPAAGATCAAAASSLAVMVEALAARLLCRGALLRVRAIQDEDDKTPLTLGRVASFYGPLAATSVIALAVQPMVTLLVGHSRLALESLAVLPVVGGLVFVFRTVGLSYQEVVIALLGDRAMGYAALKRFAMILAAASSLLLLGIAATPLATFWLEKVSGLEPSLATIGLPPLLILSVIPASTVLISFERALMVAGKKTRSLTVAMFWELGAAITVLVLAVLGLDLVGATAAAWALVAGRAASIVYLLKPAKAALRHLSQA